MMSIENYGWKLAGVVVGALYPRLEHSSFALRVTSEVSADAEEITIAVSYHGHQHPAPLKIGRSTIEDNLAEVAALTYAEAVAQDPLIQAQPAEFRAAAKARVRELEREFERENHPVIAAIGRLQLK